MNPLHIDHKRVNILELALLISCGESVPNWVLCGQQHFFLFFDVKNVLGASIVLETNSMFLTENQVR